MRRAADNAQLVDTHVVNELQRYLGDFERWQEQLLVGYASDRDRLEREVAGAQAEVEEADRKRDRAERAVGSAEDDAQTQAAMRGAAHWAADAEQARTRLRAAEEALDAVPTEAPADSMLDFYNELGEAIRGRLAGADTWLGSTTHCATSSRRSR